ncbi:unnamed protein product [Arctia plantaginis]|uniref:Uncharacterized protein n=1 Tax=Arctia plantaginis TaxID=874455 RepID=A0A8S0YLJ9_ARCPL|nr:unnamed protein product [Arctia plantaginis]
MHNPGGETLHRKNILQLQANVFQEATQLQDPLPPPQLPSPVTKDPVPQPLSIGRLNNIQTTERKNGNHLIRKSAEALE